MCDVEKKLGELCVARREVVSIVFAGHVDAGKSTIGGQVLNALGLIDKRTLEKYREQARERNRESWYLSWALDTDESERERGKTAEVGRAYFFLKSKKVVLLDAPGHSMYVSDMIVGANQADIAVLVVSARKSEFEAGFEKDGQTREHIYLCRAGGIRKMIVLVNKMDDVGWAEERFEHIKTRLKTFLQRVYGPQEIFYVPVSGTGGENILARNEKCAWYAGETFLGLLERICVARDVDAPFSFSVTEKIKNLGVTTFEGKVLAGTLRCAAVGVLPRGIETAIVAIFDEEDAEIAEAVAGDFVKVKLRECYDQIEEGDLFMEPKCTGFSVSDEFSCALTILDTHNIVGVGYKCVIHIGVSKKECKITAIAAVVDGKVIKKRFAKKGEKVLARVQVETPIVLADGGAMDMFALRNENLTIALGVVKKVIKK